MVGRIRLNTEIRDYSQCLKIKQPNKGFWLNINVGVHGFSSIISKIYDVNFFFY